MAQKFEPLVEEDLNLGIEDAWVTAPGGGLLRATQVGIHSFARGVEVDTGEQGLAHYWKLDEVSGIRYDSVGAYHWLEAGTVSQAAGVVDSAAFFSVSEPTSYLYLLNGPQLTSAFTISIRYKVPSTTSVVSLIYSTSQFWIGILSHKIYVEVYAWNGSTVILWPAGVVDDGSWHQTVLWVDPSVDLFVHLATDGGADTPSGLPLTGTFVAASAVSSLGSEDDVTLDEVKWYSRALSSAERNGTVETVQEQSNQSSHSAAWTPGAIAAGLSATTTLAVPESVTGDFVIASHDKMLTNGLRISGHVSVAGTVEVVMHNPTAASITVAAGTVKVLVFPGYDASVTPLVADFTVDNHSPGIGSVDFTDTTTGGIPAYTYSWDFGDASSSSLQNPNHVYSMGVDNPQTFTVTLTVTDSVGTVDSTAQPVIITWVE